MAGIETFNIPTTYEYYKGEKDFVSPKEVKNATQAKIDRIKARKIGGLAITLSDLNW